MELGVKQAAAISRRLRDETFDAIYSSDLGRALATAKAIASSRGLVIQTTDLLREAYLGLAQGLTTDEFAERYPDAFCKWREDSVANRPPEGETFEHVINRCRAFLDHIAGEHSGEARIVAVAHGGSLRGLICAALDLPPAFFTRIRTANASLSILEITDRPVLRLLNDTCHLDSLATEAEADDLSG
jgi:alpha-ribazole phosphatase